MSVEAVRLSATRGLAGGDPVLPFDSNRSLGRGSRSGFHPPGIVEGATGLPVEFRNLIFKESNVAGGRVEKRFSELRRG